MKLEDVLKRCEATGSWYGIKINNLTQTNNIGDTPLHTVCSWGEPESARLLIESGADVNALGDLEGTPLFNAIISNDSEVVKLLLKSGAKKNLANIYGDKPLQYAENVTADPKIIKLLS